MCLHCRAAEKVGTSAAAGGQWGAAYFKRTTEAAAEGIRKLTGSTLAVCAAGSMC